MERRRIVRLMSGIEARIRPQILDLEHKLTKKEEQLIQKGGLSHKDGEKI